MYPDHAFAEFYPMTVVEKILNIYWTDPRVTILGLHRLMQEEWVRTNPREAADYGYPRKSGT